jgi:mitochondrial fission protein ELM1
MPHRILTCSTDHAGTLAQVEGVALAIARKLRAEDGQPTEILRHHWTHDLARHLGLTRSLDFDVIVSSGSSGARKALRLRRLRNRSLWVHLEALVYEGERPDLHAVPAHDWQPDFETPGHLRLAGAPHRLLRDVIEARRGAARSRFGLSPSDRAAVFLLGGTSRAFVMDAAAAQSVAGEIRRVAGNGYRCFVTASRRTPHQVRTVFQGLIGPSVTLWDGTGDNPYLDFLALADCLFVSEDSISMTCEAATLQRPLYRLDLTPIPGPALDKLRRFQALWSEFQLPAAAFEPDARWTAGTPPDDAEAIAVRTLELMRRLA